MMNNMQAKLHFTADVADCWPSLAQGGAQEIPSKQIYGLKFAQNQANGKFWICFPHLFDATVSVVSDSFRKQQYAHIFGLLF